MCEGAARGLLYVKEQPGVGCIGATRGRLHRSNQGSVA